MVRYRGRMFSPCRLDVPNMVERAAEILETEKRRAEELEAADYSQLEFKAVDANPSPRKQIRVGKLPKDVTRTSAKLPCGSLEFDSLEFEEELIPHQGNLHLLEQERANDGGAEAEMPPVEGAPTAGNEDQPMDVAMNEPIGAVETAEATEEEPPEQENAPDPAPLNQFKEYIKKARKDFHRLSDEMIAGIELMNLMNECGGSASLYELVFQWHLQHIHVRKSVTADKLHSRLLERYNLGPTLPKEQKVYLPHAKQDVLVPLSDFKAQVLALLTDPRWTDDDYVFHNDDPHSDPPEVFETVGEPMTSLATRKTHEALVGAEPWTEDGWKKMASGVQFYGDATQTTANGQSIEIIKFTLTIFNSKAREKDHAWRHLGIVRIPKKQKKNAEDNILESGHVDANTFVSNKEHRGKQFMQSNKDGPLFDSAFYTGTEDATPPALKQQDLHCIMQAILDSFKEVEIEGGLPFEHRFKGHTYKLLHKFFIHTVRADTKEADKFCGSYGTNLEGVKNICRMCDIPADQTDQVYLTPEPARKTQDMVLNLVKAGDQAQLKNLSQHAIWNCFYSHRFGMHNNCGIHGASPMETLHWVQLNLYKYNRDSFFDQVGHTSALSKKMDALAQTYGVLLERQSQRDMPRTRFSQGIRGPFLQAHEMSGVMVLLLLSIRSMAGRNLLLNGTYRDAKAYFPSETEIKNWIRLLETHLMFEQWLEKDEHEVHLLERAKVKVREMMSLTKFVGQRTKGRGYKTNTFHTGLHMPQLALELGSPKHWNVKHNEKHHKRDKKTALRTSKHFDTFDSSVAQHNVYKEAIDLGMEEVHNGLCKWNYYRRAAFLPIPPPQPFEPTLTGPSVFYEYNPESEFFVPQVLSKMTGKENYKYDENTLEYILSTATDIHHDDNNITYFKTFGTLRLHSPSNPSKPQLFHAQPYTKGKPWYDWAIFDLSDPDSDVPGARTFVAAQIKCFIDFRHIPQVNGAMKPPGIYAIIEPTVHNATNGEKWLSKLLEPICKQPCPIHGFEGHNKQDLVSIERIRQPATVVPDLDNPNQRAYLRLTPKAIWAGLYDQWLAEPHEREFG